MLSLIFEPFSAAAPIRFGMTPADVRRILGLEAHSKSSYLGLRDDTFPGLRVGYSVDLLVREVSAWPDPELLLFFQGQQILGPGANTDPLIAFMRVDPKPTETVGFIVFPALGVAVTGYHDHDISQRAISMASSGVWDQPEHTGTPIDLTAYKPSSA